MLTSALGSSLADLRRSTIARLRAAGVESPALDANVLIGHVLGVAPEQVALQLDAELRPGNLRSIEAATQRRERREPVAYITGTRAFRRLQVSVNRDVLIPRPESELLVEVGLERWDASPGSVLADIGTGSGAIALALADERPGRCVVGWDCSHAALRVASGNARRLQLEERVDFRHGDGSAAIGLEDSVVVANLPYIPSAVLDTLEPEVSRWEPRVALDGGADGLAVIRVVAAQVGRGRARSAAFEIGPGQAGAVAMLLREAGFKDTAVHRDLAGHPRVVAGTRVS
ncbi:MAG: peptide chain release factor N(5)-glutamine methyltransferase [Chloroflexota bacterium]|nr:peptide chain release factor N(5)-glutamine methyltransferase [Chloroflexota bacterium]